MVHKPSQEIDERKEKKTSLKVKKEVKFVDFSGNVGSSVSDYSLHPLPP